MIDMHIHAVPPQLPGVGSLNPCLRLPPEEVAKLIQDEMRSAGIQYVLSMGSLSSSIADPLGIQSTLRISSRVPGMFAIGIANPEHNDAAFIRAAESQILEGKVVALKAYLGYLHYYPSDVGYHPYYKLAEKYHLPFIFHTGDTYSPEAKLKFAHPLGIDEVAVDFPNVSFVIAHVGNPWMLDAAEIVYKNLNVWADLSGLFIGDQKDFNDPDWRCEAESIGKRLKEAFDYSARPNRFLYGSDWPLAPMNIYRQMIRQTIPENFHEQIFFENAQRLFFRNQLSIKNPR